ncbi:hypothetical protein EV385_2008 [Krasilnikovia cinnamomea]|uniref:Uncharacterized protein n=2 Tax=Krasilnikovia cinnamomea TaxID=349313 RepID=A0A4Q7ZHE6_9ACTN|nr:hypothetical protein EV385_2008 [Krasilnikovia cinnamomea]
MTVTGIALICVGLVLLVAFRAVVFGGRKRRQARTAAANRRAQLPAAPVDGPWAAQLPPASPDGPWAAELPSASPDDPWAAEPHGDGRGGWDAPGGHPGRPVRGGGQRPRSADEAAPAIGAPARRSRGRVPAATRTRARADGSARIDTAAAGYADGAEPGHPAKERRGARGGERRTMWLDPDPDAGAVVRSVPVVAGAAEPASAVAADADLADDIVDEPGSRRFRRRRGSTGAAERRRRRDEDEDSQYVLASLGLADDGAPERDGDDPFEALDPGDPDHGRTDPYDGVSEPRPDDPSGFGDRDDPRVPMDFSSTGPGADEPADPGFAGSTPDADGTGGSGAMGGVGGLAATLLDDDAAGGGAPSGAGVGLGRGEFDRAGTAQDPESRSPYRAAAPAPRGWPADRSDQRYGDRVEGWVRPEYRELPEVDTAGAYWTPAPDGPYVEPSASGYGWPVPVERLPAAPPYEPVTGFDLPPVSDLTTVVPTWPPAGTEQPRFAPARDSGSGILWGSARDDTVWGDSGVDEVPEPYGWPPAGPQRRSPGPVGDPVVDRFGAPEREPRFGPGGSARRTGPPRGSVRMPGSASVPAPGFGRPRDFGAPSGLGVAPVQGLGPARGFGRTPGIGRPSGYAPAQGIGPEAVALPGDDRDLRARPRPRPRPRPGGADARSTVYVSRHAADPG